MKSILTSLFFVFIVSVCNAQNLEIRTKLGLTYAKQKVYEQTKTNSSKNLQDTLIKIDSIAIKIAEKKLFELYGKNKIEYQKPYECYLIERYWFIAGTLEPKMKGGVFEIIIDSKDGKIIYITHSK